MLPTFKLFAPGKTTTRQILRGAFVSKDVFSDWIWESIHALGKHSQSVTHNGRVQRNPPEWETNSPLSVTKILNRNGLNNWLATWQHASHKRHATPRIIYIGPDGGKANAPL